LLATAAQTKDKIPLPCREAAVASNSSYGQRHR